MLEATNKLDAVSTIGCWDPSWRTAIFIDGANLHAVMSQLGFTIDYSKLYAYFSSRCDLVQIRYYTAVRTERDGQKRIMPLIDWLDHNGFTVIQKPARTFTGDDGVQRTKGNMDIEMAVDMFRLSTCRNPIDHAILFTGDGDFAYAVAALQDQGIRVTVVCTATTNPPMIANILRRQANIFLELAELKEVL